MGGQLKRRLRATEVGKTKGKPKITGFPKGAKGGNYGPTFSQFKPVKGGPPK